MPHCIPESDWKVFRELRDLALEPFSRRILAKVAEIAQDDARSAHDRYRDLWRLLRDRDEDVARAFDDPRRSRLVLPLAAIYRLRLLETDEFARFSAETRDAVESWSKVIHG